MTLQRDSEKRGPERPVGSTGHGTGEDLGKESHRISPWARDYSVAPSWMIVVVWIPFLLALLFHAFWVQRETLSPWHVFVWGPLGLLTWTLVEYVIHRFIFHFSAKGGLLKDLVYFFHLGHHETPNDPKRCLVSPLISVPTMAFLWGVFSLVVPSPHRSLFVSFFIIGYLIYDYTHYQIHFGDAKTALGRFLERQHLAHHYADDRLLFGVTSPLWDLVFRTRNGEREA